MVGKGNHPKIAQHFRLVNYIVLFAQMNPDDYIYIYIEGHKPFLVDDYIGFIAILIIYNLPRRMYFYPC